MKLFIKINLFILVSMLFTACSNTRPYLYQGNQNLTVHTVKKSNSYLTGIGIDMHIYKVNSCTDKQYLGSIDLLKKPTTSIALPSDELLMLKVEFSYTSISYSGTMEDISYLKIRPGFIYHADVVHAKGVYNVTITETNPATKQTREIDIDTLEGC